MFHLTRHGLLVITAALGMSLLGCESDNGDDNADLSGEERISVRTDADLDRDREDIVELDVDRDRPLGGRIPEDAVLLRDWENDRLSFTAERDGHIYIYDEKSNRIVYSDAIQKGDRFVLDRELNRATVNGRVIYNVDREAGRSYRVYFDRR